MSTLLYLLPAFGLLALAHALYTSMWIKAQSPGNEALQTIGRHIREGAMAFLRREYIVLAGFVIVVAILLSIGHAIRPSSDTSALLAVAFVVGALTSGLAGFFGMRVATLANVRTAHAAETGLEAALRVAFSGGSVMGMSVVGLGMLGLSSLMLILGQVFGLWEILLPGADTRVVSDRITLMMNTLAGFSLGASSIALFARVGGGIYTKAADVGADLVGKVEAGIPEDDPRNPAVIADNVGDNVGDVAGMGADLFESYVGAIIGAMVLSVTFGMPELSQWTTVQGAPVDQYREGWQVILGALMLPMALAAGGIVSSIIGTAFVRVREGGDPQKALNRGSLVAAGVMLVASAPIIYMLLPPAFMIQGDWHYPWHLWLTLAVGLLVGTAIGYITEYYCSYDYKPTQMVANAARQGPATVVIQGTAVGMASTAGPIILIAFAIIFAYAFAGLYGVALAGLGMLSTLGMQLSVDAYGPISDNAGGIAEMGHLGPEVRARTDRLDAVGNTTAAIGKGFAIGSAALTALALFAAFTTKVTQGLAASGQPALDLQMTDRWVVSGLFLGAMLPFVFSAMSMNAVGRAAQGMIDEVRRQFREIPGLLKGDPGAKADYARCVDIATQSAIKEMVAPGILAVAVPTITGFVSLQMLTGLLAGATVTGVCLAIYMATAGGSWDNAKKYIEKGGISGEKKGGDAHKAAVVGDTVGDPFKDTSGPALNILIKLMAVVAMVLAPLFVRYHIV